MTTPRNIQFHVSMLKPYFDHVVVAGRCLGDTILIGDSFTTIYDEISDPDWEKGTYIARPARLHLLVERIIGCGCDPDFVDPGRSARLVLTGEGAHAVSPDAVIANQHQLV